MAMEAKSQSFAFIICTASGHINPSFPIARGVVGRGHTAHYLAGEQMQSAVEDTGATFHDVVAACPELYEGRTPDVIGALGSMMAEEQFGLSKDDSFLMGWSKLKNVQQEMQLPGTIRFLKAVKADCVVYCPMMNREAAMAARILKIPSVPLYTTAGPGSMAALMTVLLGKEGRTPESAAAAVEDYELDRAAMRRIGERHGLSLRPCQTWFSPLGYLDTLKWASLTLVTTSADLQDPVPEALARIYREEGNRFEFVGAVLDKMGAQRAGTHKFDAEHDSSHDQAAEDAEVVVKVRAARAAGRRVVLVSMGTVVTGDAPEFGWNGRFLGPNGQPRGLTGCELCRGAWGGAFDAFGSKAEDEGALLVVSIGQQPDALGDLVAPPNAICMPSVPQVDVLKAGVDLFLTHGGQNSFTESLASSVPLLVCPGFGDQVVNGRKAVSLGAGLMVDRPNPDAGGEAEACAAYRSDVRRSLLELASEPSYAAGAARVAENLRVAGGAERAVQLVLEAASKPPKEPRLSKQEAAAAAARPAAVPACAGA